MEEEEKVEEETIVIPSKKRSTTISNPMKKLPAKTNSNSLAFGIKKKTDIVTTKLSNALSALVASYDDDDDES